MGFSLGGLLKTVAPFALAAFTGGASLAVTMQQMVVKAAIQMAIQKVGQELGLPPQLISLAQTAAMGQMGGASADFGSPAGNALNFNGSAREFIQSAASNMSPMEAGAFNRAVDQFGSAFSNVAQKVGKSGGKDMNAQIEDFLNNMKESADDKEFAKRLGKASSFLEKLAMVLGRMMDKKMNKMVELSTQISNQTSIAQGKGDAADNAKTKLGELNGQLAAVGQELSIISNALNTAVKSIGESQTTVARKS